MKRNILLIFMVSIFVLLLTSPGFSWQGRMAGMGDAYGLIEDESDFLIHPAAIASGKDLTVYGNYRLTYDKATSWDYSSRLATLFYPYATTGKEWKNEGQVGVAFPMGVGRMGVFFEYTGIKGKYSGDETNYGFWGNTHFYSLKDDLDTYAVRVLYGLPVGSVKLGSEIQLAYRNEEKENYFSDNLTLATNYPWAAENAPALNLYPYMIPYNSQYWEALGKLSAAGMIGAMKYAFTLKGGLPISSKNKYDSDWGNQAFSLEGNVKGWNAGADALFRYPVNSNMVLPFVLSAGYKQLKRDGAGLSNYSSSLAYENEAKDFFIKVGGGMDYTPAPKVKIAAGLYYDYLYTQQSISLSDTWFAGYYGYLTYSDMPKQTEHRLTLKTAVEKELSPTLALRGGFSVYYGLVKSDYSYTAYDYWGPFIPVDMSTNGYTWGANVSIGATVKLAKVSLEPFINGGYVKYKTSGDGLAGTDPAYADFDKSNWIIGGGASLKF